MFQCRQEQAKRPVAQPQTWSSSRPWKIGDWLPLLVSSLDAPLLRSGWRSAPRSDACNIEHHYKTSDQCVEKRGSLRSSGKPTHVTASIRILSGVSPLQQLYWAASRRSFINPDQSVGLVQIPANRSCKTKIPRRVSSRSIKGKTSTSFQALEQGGLARRSISHNI